MSRIAFTTLGVLYEPRSHPRSRGFHERAPLVMQAAMACDGYIEHNAFDYQAMKYSWCEPVRPSFVSPELEGNVAMTLSLWRDLESVYAFSYQTPRHGEALRLRAEWFHKPDHPNYVAWWVADDHRPDFTEAARRIETLHFHGPTAEAFDFKQPFDAEGRPMRMDPELVKAKAGRNTAARADAQSA